MYVSTHEHGEAERAGACIEFDPHVLVFLVKEGTLQTTKTFDLQSVMLAEYAKVRLAQNF